MQVRSFPSSRFGRGASMVSFGTLLLLAGCGAEPGVDGSAGAVDAPDSAEEVESVQQALSGTTPVLLVLLKKSSASVLAHDRTWYDNFMFSKATYPSVAGYFDAISRGIFGITRAGVREFVDNTSAAFEAKAGVVVGPQSEGKDGTTIDTTRRIVKRARQLLIDANFNFAPYDTNGNGSISTSELKIFVISDYTSAGAASRSVGCKEDGDGIDICSTMNHAGHEAGVQNHTHELAHSLGAVDLYGGDGGCLSNNFTLMSCTITTANKTYYPDPWHRRFLGWQGAATETFSSLGSAFYLAPVSRDFASAGNRQYTIRRDASAAQGEKLVFEWRVHDTTYDKNVGSQGVFVWYQNTSSSGALKSIPSIDDPDVNDPGHFVVGTNGNCVLDASIKAGRGKGTSLQLGAKYRFKWPDGDDSGWLIEVLGLATENRVLMQWTKSTTPAMCPG